MKKAFVHFAEGFEEIEALTIVDVLRRAEIPVSMISVTGNLTVTGAHDIRVTTDVLFEDADYDEAELLILPGGTPGAYNLNAHEGLKEQLKMFHDGQKRIAAICAAPLVLGGLHILENKKATCYPGYENELLGASLSTDKVVKSGKVITSRGPGTALDFALELVAELKGPEAANQLAKGMLVQTW
ncbi:MAG: DJ-1/PfpI family protein [Bacteroidales bacterium]|jgi:4-methyl-5(b-hydroxyethyl)-thiazole monophosphate biosynthesis